MKNIFDVDLSELEKRVAAQLNSKEIVDAHSEKAVELFEANFTPKQRQFAKCCNFLEAYGLPIKVFKDKE